MKVAVLVSGGVDSSVALKLLKDQGHDITAFYLKIWLEDELSYLGDCPWEQDLVYVRKVCAQLDVPLEVVSLQKEYWDEVVSYAIAEVKAGRTPNPDVLCNQRVKFGAFLAKFGQKFDKIASGHYARAVQKNDCSELHMSPDPIKDQTYFLSHLSQDQLAKLLFPIGHLKKEEIRRLAAEFDLATKDRKDSQGICFLGKISFADFLKHHLGEKSGDLVEFETREKVGTHRGFWFYTIGQRQGLGLAGGPWYVVAKDTEENIVYISRNYYAADKVRNSFSVSDCSWFAGVRPEKTNLQVKVRHGKQLYPCTTSFKDDTSADVIIDGSDQGIAAGQFAAFYDGDVCLGSGIITQSDQKPGSC